MNRTNVVDMVLASIEDGSIAISRFVHRQDNIALALLRSARDRLRLVVEALETAARETPSATPAAPTTMGEYLEQRIGEYVAARDAKKESNAQRASICAMQSPYPGPMGVHCYCTEPRDHTGDHRAGTIAGEIVGSWPRRVPTSVLMPCGHWYGTSFEVLPGSRAWCPQCGEYVAMCGEADLVNPRAEGSAAP